MKRAMFLWMCVLGGCMTDPELPAAESQDGLIYEPSCDPGDHSYEAALHGAYDHGFKLFADAVPDGQSCADVDVGWECVVMFTTATNPCGPVAVDCLDLPTHGRSRVNCHAKAIDNCH